MCWWPVSTWRTLSKLEWRPAAAGRARRARGGVREGMNCVLTWALVFSCSLRACTLLQILCADTDLNAGQKAFCALRVLQAEAVRT